MTDSHLVAMARAGDKAAFVALMERHEEAMVRAALRVTRDPEAAREVVQEAVVAAYLSLRYLRDDESAGAWLRGIAANVARQSLRVRRTTGPLSDVAAESAPDAAVERREVSEAVRGALDALPSKSREAATLFYVERLSLREIAHATGSSIVAVKGRLHRARRHLQDRLGWLYRELYGRPARRKERPMTRLVIADVVPLDEGTCAVVLVDAAGGRVLPIWIDPAIGRLIALALRGRRFPRPLTYDLMANLLEATEATADRVRIEALRESTFYAVVQLRVGERTRDVDARPSDALALAVRLNAPIFAADDVLATAGVPIPDEYRQKRPIGRGIDQLVKDSDARAGRTTRTEIQDLLAFVFADAPA